MSPVQTLVINLARETARMAFQQRQLICLGLPFRRIEAVTPDTLSPGPDDPLWHRWQRPLRVTEMALLASHRAAWQAVLAAARPCLILEDDALLARGTPALLRRIADRDDIDHISLEARGRKKMVARRRLADLPLRRLYQDRTGSAAYVLFPRGAQVLLARTAQVAAPSDAAISSAYALRACQADPALAIQLDQCARYGIPLPLATASSIDAVRKPPAAEHYSRADQRGFRRRRLLAQLEMGWRQLSHVPLATRRHIEPAQDWPELGRVPYL